MPGLQVALEGKAIVLSGYAAAGVAAGILSDDERARVVDESAGDPKAGAPLGGGIRKMRISRPGRGRSGGARVVFLLFG